MNEKKLHESVNQALDLELDKIDTKTLDELRTIRRNVIASATGEVVTSSHLHLQNGVASLSAHPEWRNKKWVFIGLVFVMCVTWIFMQGITQQDASHDIPLDFALYTEVDPDWLMDMEIAETFGDE